MHMHKVFDKRHALLVPLRAKVFTDFCKIAILGIHV